MKKYLLYFITFGLSYFPFTGNLYAQISQGGTPFSFSPYFEQLMAPKSQLKTILLPKMEDAINQKSRKKDDYNLAGKGIPVNMDLKNSGEWLTTPDGDRVWRLKVKSEGALNLSVLYDDFYLPEGAEFFVYNESKTQVMGAYTSANNHPSNAFTTALIEGEVVVLEYYEPATQKGKGRIHIAHFSHGLKPASFHPTNKKEFVKFSHSDFGDSEACHINVNCPLGDNWQDEKKAIMRILVFFANGSAGWCSGALINNTLNDATPYVLSAFHCQDKEGTTPSYANWVFYFNFEASSCTNPLNQPSTQSLVGCTEKAKAFNSDFLLLQLNNSVPLNFNPYYAGWDRTNTTPTSVVGIHHPAGDIKKISQSTGTINTLGAIVVSGETYPAGFMWGFNWTEGSTEGGSSGSPLFEPSGKIIGQLLGGSGSCNELPIFSIYGKISQSWTAGLSAFLDPTNLGLTQLNGLDPNGLLDADLGTTNITTNVSGCDFTNSTLFKADIKNFGSQTQTNVPIEFSVKNSQGTVIQSGEVSLNTIAPNETKQVDIMLNLATKGDYVVEVSTALLGDQQASNNTLSRNFSNVIASQKSSNITFDNAVFFQTKISWTSGDGQERLVLLKEGSPITTAELPVNGTSYPASSIFGTSTPIGQAFPVYRGASANSVTVSQLSGNTTYHVAIIDFSCSPPKYLLSDFATASNIVTSIEKNQLQASLTLFPNPASESLNIQIKQATYQFVRIQLLNVLGQPILVHSLNRNNEGWSSELSVNNLPKGVYFMKITTDRAETIEKIMIQ